MSYDQERRDRVDAFDDGMYGRTWSKHANSEEFKRGQGRRAYLNWAGNNPERAREEKRFYKPADED